MDKSKKIYIKAIDKYNNGYIDKAIELCEESISLDIKNSAAINLKGLLFYFKGELDSSQKIWKMNYQINKDSVSQRYLIDSKGDSERQNLYNTAVSFINELKISEALDALKKCEESDYNCINVNNCISWCYLSKGDYDKAFEYIEKVFKLDKNNVAAKENIKLLKKYGCNISVWNMKKVLIVSFCLLFLIMMSVSIRYIEFNKLISTNKQISNKYISSFEKYVKNMFKQPTPNIVKDENNKSQNSKVQGNKQQTSIESKGKTETEVFPSDKIKSDIQNKSFDDLYEEYMKWRDKNISEDNKLIILQAGELLKGESVEYFYNKGCASLNNKNYSDAKVSLTKAYTLDVHSDLYTHVVYMLATSCELSGDIQNAIQYYIQYDNSFDGGIYQDTVLYKLVILNKDSNKEMAKKYAQKLMSKYPNSMYNNSIVNEVANS
ncbi:hypothetical protein JMF89_04465 [Clostridiaceae bacterium UIB06]|uniref:Tetratricopeptide repeat protein n=1 Tax=Clostridium thailandense TaxID=2794346 RepID=A0A949TTF3_9CLOT|nr:tetratricopeptide repeat protein [Clostridium thailandense]MBV7271561.1 hypothetical protein [Clostridium thailandense]MCH5136469.1 hypothetical protein [Clostridiaceae bacterium UIB06]